MINEATRKVIAERLQRLEEEALGDVEINIKQLNEMLCNNNERKANIEFEIAQLKESLGNG